MIAFVVQRLLQSVLVMLAVAFISFALFRYIGDPVLIMLGQDFTREQYEMLVRDLGLDQPFYVQFAKFVVSAVQGEFGISYRLARPVAQLIAERLPATLELSMMAALLALTIGVPMGVYTGLRRDSWLSRFFLTISLVGVSLPTFLIGILLILVFAVQLGWLPTGGYVPLSEDPVGWLRSMAMPALALALTQIGLLARMTRASMLDVLRQDFMRTARAKGLPNRVVIFKHALANVMIPVITVIGLSVGILLGGAIVIEQVFSIPGVGRLIIGGILRRDFPVIQGGLLLTATVFVLVNLAVDILYAVVDPRVRYDR